MDKWQNIPFSRDLEKFGDEGKFNLPFHKQG